MYQQWKNKVLDDMEWKKVDKGDYCPNCEYCPLTLYRWSCRDLA